MNVSYTPLSEFRESVLYFNTINNTLVLSDYQYLIRKCESNTILYLFKKNNTLKKRIKSVKANIQ